MLIITDLSGVIHGEYRIEDRDVADAACHMLQANGYACAVIKTQRAWRMFPRG